VDGFRRPDHAVDNNQNEIAQSDDESHAIHACDFVQTIESQYFE